MPKIKSDKRGTSLLLMQGVACGLLLLVALAIRLIGGGVYDKARDVLYRAMTDDGVAETVLVFLEQNHA